MVRGVRAYSLRLVGWRRREGKNSGNNKKRLVMIPLYKPYMPDLPELESILHSGALSYGKWGKSFENKLRDFIGIKNLLTTNSYTSAIQVALTALGLHPGDEVITSPMSCLASNQPLQTFGLKIVWADIVPLTGTLNPDSVRQKITDKTRLIFHNHFCGYVGYVDEINMIGREYGIPVLDDCVEAFGGKYKGNYTGNLGTDVTIFSFQTVRLPNTIDGGAIVFKDSDLYKKALLTRDFGIRRDIFRDKYNEISAECDISLPGYGATMSDMNSYIGCCQMDKIMMLLERQQQNAAKWDNIIEQTYPRFFRINQREEIQPSYWVYGFLCDRKIEVMLDFRKQGYYASGVHLNNNCYSVFGNTEKLCGVNTFMKKFVAIPCGWWFEK